jgi:hypothetical protein
VQTIGWLSLKARTDLPDGQISLSILPARWFAAGRQRAEIACSKNPISQAASTDFGRPRLGLKNIASVFPKNMIVCALSRLHQRGVSRSSRTWEAGCDGRFGSCAFWARTNEREADGKVVWSCPPDAGVKLAGDDRQATVAKKPGTPRRARSSR